MRVIHRHALVLYSAEKMFDLVNAVEQYPSFLPWCSKSNVISANAQEMVASLTISKGKVSQQFTTHNFLERPCRIELKLVDGPFDRFSGCWQFISVTDSACKVALDLDFQFTSNVARLALGKAFDVAADNLVDAFCKRARDIYESKSN